MMNGAKAIAKKYNEVSLILRIVVGLVIALIWAAAGCALYTGEELLALGGGGSTAVYDVCSKTMGGVGIALAMLGVIACPITSGDTAFRSARLVLADWFHMEQKSWKNRLILCVPVLGVGAILGIGNALGKIDYTIIWRYFSWSNHSIRLSFCSSVSCVAAFWATAPDTAAAQSNEHNMRFIFILESFVYNISC